MAFAAHADLGVRLGITLTSGEQTRATALIAMAQALIQTGPAEGQLIELVSGDAVTLSGSYVARIRLPQRPVVSVASVVLDGDTLEADDWYLDGDELVRVGIWPTSQNRFSVGGAWGDPSQPLVVTYTHGYATIPGVIKAVCLEMVARVWMNPGNTTQYGFGVEQVSHAAANGLLLTEDEEKAVRGAIGNEVGTVVLR